MRSLPTIPVAEGSSLLEEISAEAQAALHAPSRSVAGLLLSLAGGFYAGLGCAGAAELVMASRGATGRLFIGLWSGLQVVKLRGLGHRTAAEA